MSATHRERYEDLEKLTNEKTQEFLTRVAQEVSVKFSSVLGFTQAMIQTQTRELTLLREFEALCRESETLSDIEDSVRGVEISKRLDQILLSLTLFRDEVAANNAQG